MAMTRRGFFGALAGLVAAVGLPSSPAASATPPAPSLRPPMPFYPEVTFAEDPQFYDPRVGPRLYRLEAAEEIACGELVGLTSDGRACRYHKGEPIGRAIAWVERFG